MDQAFKDRYFPNVAKKKKKGRKLPQIVKDMRSHVKREIDYSYQKNISYSQVSIYNTCPKKWSLQYKEGHKKFNSNIHTVFGTAIHETIQEYLEIMYAESGAAADRIDLIELFENKLIGEYNAQYKKNKKKHFSSAQELGSFFGDGKAILIDFKKHKSKWFSKKGVYLVGCEIPITINPDPKLPNAIFQGYIDIVLYDEDDNRIKIIDIKTSTKSWGSYQKKDKSKQQQLLLYKKFFSQQFNFPIDNIDIEFFIVKRKIYEDAEYAQKRVQIFVPPSGKTSINRASNNLDTFIKEAFAWDGYSSKNHKITPSDFGCKFCVYSETSLCPK